jgi:hypothetical protein
MLFTIKQMETGLNFRMVVRNNARQHEMFRIIEEKRSKLILVFILQRGTVSLMFFLPDSKSPASCKANDILVLLD